MSSRHHFHRRWFVLGCLVVAGCAWDRSYFHLDSNSRIPFFGLEFRWPPTANVTSPHDKQSTAADDEPQHVESALDDRRLTIRALER